MGHVTVVGGCRAKAPSTGILASTLPVGSMVKLMENGTAVEYLVVNQGIPSNSNLYDASCNGTWLLRKECHSERQWDSSQTNVYASSTINTWLNNNFFNNFGSVEQSVVKQVKIPFCVGGGDSTINSGASGLSTKIFLVSNREVGFTKNAADYYPTDGAKLDYFESGTSDSANQKRVAWFNGSTVYQWLRSPYLDDGQQVWRITTEGGALAHYATYTFGIRPALILPSNALFDKTTMLLKGVA